MAEFVVQGLDGFADSLRQLAELPEHVQDDILNAQADALIPELQERGRAYGVENSGKMLRSIKKGKVRVNKDGRYIVVAPRGTRKRVSERTGKVHKVKEAEIGFFANYGTRNQRAMPFWTDTIQISAATLIREGRRVFYAYMDELNL